MVNRMESVLHDTRRNIRIQENKSVAWRVNGGELQGKGKIKDISTSGMKVEMHSDSLPLEGTVVSFDGNLGHNNFIPQNGRLVWSNPKGKSGNRFDCGIQFIEPGEFVLTKLRQRVQKGIIRIHNMRRLEIAGNAFLIALIVGLTGYLIWQSGLIYQDINRANDRLMTGYAQQSALTQSYAYRYQAAALQLLSVGGELEATRQLYVESESMLQSVREELESTKQILAQTENMLASARAANPDAAAGSAGLSPANETAGAQMQTAMAQLQARNAQLEEEMATLRSQYQFLSGDIQNTAEGRTLIALYKTKIGDVRKRIDEFQAQARQTRIEAAQERDRIKLLLGNNGYFIKDGTVVQVDEEKYHAADRIAAPQTAAPAARDVNIDVTFVD